MMASTTGETYLQDDETIKHEWKHFCATLLWVTQKRIICIKNFVHNKSLFLPQLNCNVIT